MSTLLHPHRETADLNAALWTAIERGDARAAFGAIADGARVDGRGANGLTPLMLAAAHGNLDLVQVLVEAGADVFTTDTQAGATPLHKACQGGSVEVVRVLLDAGAHVDAVAAMTGHTPLMDAVWFKQPAIAGELLARGARIELSTHYGFSFLDHLAYETRVNVVGADAIVEADRLVKDRQAADQQAMNDQLLMSAVARGAENTVERLLGEGADVNARFPIVTSFNDGHTPLHVACRDGHTRIVELLLAAGSDVNAVEPTFGAVPLHKATYNGHADIVRLLVAAPGVDLDVQGATNGYTPLHDALWHGYADCAAVLVEAGARLDLRGHDGATPMQLARQAFRAGLDVVDLITRRL